MRGDIHWRSGLSNKRQSEEETTPATWGLAGGRTFKTLLPKRTASFTFMSVTVSVIWLGVLVR